MDDIQSRDDWIADQEQRIVDLEAETKNLRTIIERIGREKRTCAVNAKTTIWIYILMMFMAVDIGMALLAILK